MFFKKSKLKRQQIVDIIKNNIVIIENEIQISDHKVSLKDGPTSIFFACGDMKLGGSVIKDGILVTDKKGILKKKYKITYKELKR